MAIFPGGNNDGSTRAHCSLGLVHRQGCRATSCLRCSRRHRRVIQMRRRRSPAAASCAEREGEGRAYDLHVVYMDTSLYIYMHII